MLDETGCDRGEVAGSPRGDDEVDQACGESRRPRAEQFRDDAALALSGNARIGKRISQLGRFLERGGDAKELVGDAVGVALSFGDLEDACCVSVDSFVAQS